MPITIQHGTTEAASGLAGIMQTAMRIEADRQAREIQSQAAARNASRTSSTGSSRSSGIESAVYSENIRAYENERAAAQGNEYKVAGRQQEAQLDRENFEYEYSAKQRMKIAQLNNAKQEIQNSENFSPEEKLSATRHLELQLGNMAPTASPVDPNKPPYAGTEQDVGMTWSSETGGVYTRNADGRVVELTKPSDTERGIERAAEIKQQEERQKRVWELLTEDIKYFSETSGKEETKRRKPSEVFAILTEEQQVMGMLEQAKQAAEQRKIEQAEAEAQAEIEREQYEIKQAEAEARYPAEAERMMGENAWIRQAQEAGLPITEADLDLGPEIGPKQVMLRKLTIDSQQRTLTKEEETKKKALTEELLAINGDEQAGSFAVRERPEPTKKLRRRKLSSTGALSGMLRHT